MTVINSFVYPDPLLKLVIQTTAPNETFTLPLEEFDYATGAIPMVYDFEADWGDGQSDLITAFNQAERIHTYITPGVYTVSIRGRCDKLAFTWEPAALQLYAVSNWGEWAPKDMAYAFAGCANLVITASDILDLSGVLDMTESFEDCANVNNGFEDWDVSTVVTFDYCFYGCAAFNCDISNWTFPNPGTSFVGMFVDSGFNQNISGWDVGNVVTMAEMFWGTPFNQDISAWNVSGCTILESMFAETTAFNQDLSNWDVSGCTDFFQMFRDAAAFNSPLIGWDVSNATNLREIFWCPNVTSVFNASLANWTLPTGHAYSLRYMFYNCAVFNGSLAGWNPSKCTSMRSMFQGAAAFNQDISAWDTGDVTDMVAMFRDAVSFNQDISGWDVAAVTAMEGMFRGATVFNQDISGWNVSSNLWFIEMFRDAPAFNQNLSGWNIDRAGLHYRDMFWGAAGFSTANYDALLVGWAAQTPPAQGDVNGIRFSSNYTISVSQTARNYLTSAPRNWIITDLGGI